MRESLSLKSSSPLAGAHASKPLYLANALIVLILDLDVLVVFLPRVRQATRI
jgi:hypothetical protein